MIPEQKIVLPVDELLPEIVASLRRVPNLVLEAAPGAGKTTRVPPALLALDPSKDVLVLEPRRLAARMAARRVADELGERVGETVGYQVRFEEVAGAGTRLRFLTEGVLTRRLLRDPVLAGVGCVVLDEFHERHLQTDLAIALLRRLQRTARPDLRLVVMSATIEVAPVVEFLGGAESCPVFSSAGRVFPVEVEHLTRPDERPLAAQIEAAARHMIAEEATGDVLVFLPGAAEIRAALDECAKLGAEHELLLLPLHGGLPADEQDRAVRRVGKRKIIFATNVAETSVTIDGVVAVIDAGLARVADRSAWSGLPVLRTERTSQASARQRAGRAGRTRAGRCLRLYTQHDFRLRPEHTAPEIARLDLTQIALELHAAGIEDATAFEWFEPPPEESLRDADALLARLGALRADGALTELGGEMLRFPLHPRLARLVVEAGRRGIARLGATAAALIGERDIRSRDVLRKSAHGRGASGSRSGSSDVLELADLFAEAERARFAADGSRGLQLDPAAVNAVRSARDQILRLCKHQERARGAANEEQDEDALSIAILCGYPDRVARRRAASDADRGSNEVMFAGGGVARLAPESVVRRAEFLVAVDADEQDERGRAGGSLRVRLASRIEPEWLLDLFTDQIAERIEATWNADAERADTVRRLVYDELVIDERRAGESDAEARAAASRVLAERAAAAGLASFGAGEEVERLLARIDFARRALPEAGVAEVTHADAEKCLIEICNDRRSFAELRAGIAAGELTSCLRARLTNEARTSLARAAPERIMLANKRSARIRYEPGGEPWVESRLQDFYGMKDAPRIADGRVTLVLHLLAPNNRAVQVTTDLAGFWTRHYPQIRRELSRRYPRHVWLENPSVMSGDTNSNTKARSNNR